MAENYQSSRVLLWRLQYRYLRRRADSFLAISEFAKREMTALLGIPPEHIDVVPSVAAKDALRFLGYVPDEDMPALYSAAEMFAFPTLYEGFEIPVIEAQRCGAPVLSSNVSALPEVGGDAAIYVDPYDVPDMARGMAELLMDGLRKAPPEELAGIRVEAAKDYSLGVDGLPKSNVLRYFLAGGMEAVIRPSGTEPKLKAYLTTVGESREKCTAAAEELENWFEEWAKQ